MKAISTITILPATKQERENYISKVVEEFNSLPNYEQSELAQRIKIAVEVFEGILKHNDVRGALIQNMEANRIETGLGEITLTERKNYSFDNCELHTKLKVQIIRLETIMKTINSAIADTETGELIEPAQVKTSEIITFKFKQK
jgi:hypothetical protein